MKNPRYLISLAIYILLAFSSSAHAEHIYKEKEYQKYWCDVVNGISEYVLSDSTKVDCLTDEYAIEFDFAEKWAEAIGQSLHYAEMTNRKPGIVLILEYPADERFRERVEQIAEKNNIKVWYLKAYESL